MSFTIPISFHYINVRFSFPQRSRTKELVLNLIKKEGKVINHINYIFCTDEYLLPLNKNYLKHSTFTDIITFHYHLSDQPLLSDIYISIERVRENAVLFGTSFRHELHRVIFHGALHLCGYGDKSKKDKTLMRQKEQEYLNLL